MTDKLNKEQLIKLVEEIVNPKLNDDEINEKIELFEKNVPHPAPSDLIFWDEEDLSPKEIVEKALNYRSINL
ncbi:hypothetical protein CHH83_22425 [Bacillus sp. 7586-K]|uniref:Colicin immunity protein / pyocin immunity protein n=1 Tax=Metabacillus niabensis TaxID=324854 RepID=A0ABT9Z2P8_9BACI|nr:bacteriocin immunity protein [Metabacillus niabensis]MDQ0225843.1 hypothetical protein [Metabacillus niabensis]PAD66761.1 hypothetical protein CHH83_22425 [Bacillus sp. 7586-K]